MDRFEFSTINDFDKHISDSIYGYDLLHNLIVNVSSFFINKDTTIIDLGCTTGKLLNDINKEYGNDCVGYDISEKHFQSANDSVTLIKQDLTNDSFSVKPTSLALSIFTLQFLKVSDRVKLLSKVFHSLSVTGCFIVCEKEICEDGRFQESFTFSNYQNKLNSFSSSEILEKEKQLRTVMHILSEKENIKMFKSAGFRKVQPFFQSLNFKGYLLRK